MWDTIKIHCILEIRVVAKITILIERNGGITLCIHQFAAILRINRKKHRTEDDCHSYINSFRYYD